MTNSKKIVIFSISTAVLAIAAVATLGIATAPQKAYAATCNERVTVTGVTLKCSSDNSFANGNEHSDHVHANHRK